MKPCSATFVPLLQPLPPQLHATPANVPDLEDWPQVKKLHVPTSTKSFLLKTFMNALPTSDRLSFTKDKNNPPCILCPICSHELSSNHFFQGKCAEKYSTQILGLAQKYTIPLPSFSLDFDHPTALHNLIYVNTLWKTICKALHSDEPNIKVQSLQAKVMYKRELQIASILFPHDFKSIGKHATPTLLDQFNLVGA